MPNKFTTKNNKITILLPYYNRPNMVQYTLKSIQNQNYHNWELFFCDDNSEFSGEEILKDYFPNYKNVFYKNTKTPLEEKLKVGSCFGKYFNEFILQSDSDICLFLCDDDALVEDYLSNLNNWYNKNSNKHYSYCHVVPFNPFEIKSFSEINFHTNWWLNRTGDINPFNAVDASQVTWKTSLMRNQGVRFRWPKTANLDAYLYGQLYSICGLCSFNGIVGQYKAIHEDQLGNRTHHDNDVEYVNYNIRDIPCPLS